MKIRERVIAPRASLGGTFQTRPTLTSLWKDDPNHSRFYNTDGIQVTESEGHPFPSKYKRGKFNGDLGGPFRTEKQYLEVDHPRLVELLWDRGKASETRFQRYRGTLISPYPETSGKPLFPELMGAPDSTLKERGAEAISFCSPTNSVADASTFLAEMFRERLPSLPGLRYLKGRVSPYVGIADEFLNVTFGWLPIKHDVEKHLEAVRKARDVLVQYKRDEGKLVRRQFRFPKERTVTEDDYLPSAIANSNSTIAGFNANGNKGVVRRRTETTRAIWFSGAFTYHIPDQNDSWAGMLKAGSDADQLFGTTITPSTLWELTPFSWAVDWFTNAQQVIQNLENVAIYGLALPYGYMMEEVSKRVTYTMIGNSGISYTGVGSLYGTPVPVSAVSPISLCYTAKFREQASPFGFGLTGEDLSPTQIAIAAALGITLLL
jgi:uncharacterized protein YndB with AHSA1/START domain